MPGPRASENSTTSSWFLYSHVQQQSIVDPPPQLTIDPPDEVGASDTGGAHATAAAIRSIRALAPIMQGEDLDAALRCAYHNSGIKGALVSLSWLLKGMVTALLIEAFAKALKTYESDDNFAQKDIVAHLLAGLIAGSLVLGLVHAFLDKRAGAWLNRCGAATIALPPNGKALATFNFWFSAVFALRSASIAGLVAANKMDFFDTDGGKNRAANALVVSLISSVWSISCGYIGTRVGSQLAVAATPAENRKAMLTVREDARGGFYVDNNGTFNPRLGTSLLGGVNEAGRFREIMLSRALAGGFSGVTQEFLSMLLNLLPFVTENGSPGRVMGATVITAYAVQQAVNGAWRVAAQEALKGVVRAKSHDVGNQDTDANTWLQKFLLLPSSESLMESFACHAARAIYTLQRAAGCMGSAEVAPASFTDAMSVGGASSVRSQISVAGTLHPQPPGSHGSQRSQRPTSRASSDMSLYPAPGPRVSQEPPNRPGSRPSSHSQDPRVSTLSDRSPPLTPGGETTGLRTDPSSTRASDTVTPPPSPFALTVPTQAFGRDRSPFQMRDSGSYRSGESEDFRFMLVDMPPALMNEPQLPSMRQIRSSMEVLQRVLNLLIREELWDDAENTPLLRGNPDDARIIDELFQKLRRELQVVEQDMDPLVNQDLNDTIENLRVDTARFIGHLRQLWAQSEWRPDALRDALRSESFGL